jgi:hypothetical protein
MVPVDCWHCYSGYTVTYFHKYKHTIFYLRKSFRRKRKMVFKNKILALTVIFALILMAAVNYSAAPVKAQSDATIIVLDSVGGTVDPAGTTTYPDGTTVTFTAMPDSQFAFDSWVIATDQGSTSSIENPLTFTVTGGVTYALQASFGQIQAFPGRTIPPSTANPAIVVVLASAGGTINPAPGTYALADATNFDLNAIASSGWQFSHWIITGASTNHGHGQPVNLTPTSNPYNVNHGYGYTYYYQAVFTPVGTTEPTPTPSDVTGGMTNETWIIIGLVIVIVVVVAAFGVFESKRKK